ncbi:methyltransferase domain-containing protein [Alkalicaulis satelles]|uniref:Methyltransferase domain-containing protein n=1 Tax=Alkalicaulis satelles TaxID=2609175 RepID=A0A5M6ZKK2_9PROT|nr:methyltransferase domain-containing protein [Alkalicaulis satelles]KAA5805349.1 methyltransferase domain-containing protein [Alkalicaulis satelles]
MSQTPASDGPDWEARFRDSDAPWERPGVHPALTDWAQDGAFDRRWRMLVPGCGRGTEPEAFARLGLSVTGVDMAPTAIAWQQARFDAAGLTGALLAADALAYRPDAPFDALWEQTFLCAIHPRLRPDWEMMAHACLKPGGVLFALFMQKDEPGGPPYGCGLDAMRQLLPGQRWIWPEGELKAYPHPGLNAKPELAARLIRR